MKADYEINHFGGGLCDAPLSVNTEPAEAVTSRGRQADDGTRHRQHRVNSRNRSWVHRDERKVHRPFPAMGRNLPASKSQLPLHHC